MKASPQLWQDACFVEFVWSKNSIHLNSSEEINPVILYGPKARGFGIECPRDKCMGTSYADALDAKHTGPANAGTSSMEGLQHD